MVDEETKVRNMQLVLEQFTRANMTLPPEFSETWSSCLSNEAFTQSTEGQGEDMQDHAKEEGNDHPPERKKRGRKPLRPLDPIRKKTEEKDKYWLRAFRAYMRAYYPTVRERLRTDEQEFWDYHLSSCGKPGKGNKYASYGKNYKQFIFSQPSFCLFFRQWFREFGELELSKKCPRNTDLWIVFHQYAAHDLYYYNELQSQARLDMGDSPLMPVELAPSLPGDGFSLGGDVGMDQDKDVDAYFSL